MSKTLQRTTQKLAGALGVAMLIQQNVSAQQVAVPFDANYQLTGVLEAPLTEQNPSGAQGGFVFEHGDPEHILIAGTLNLAESSLHRVGVVRDQNRHIIGFDPAYERVAPAPYADAGLAYAPAGVLFLARFNDNDLGEYTFDGSEPSVIDCDALGLPSSVTGLGFVPSYHLGAASFKAVCWPGGQWYDLTYQSLEDGRFAILGASYRGTIVGGPEAFAYVPPGSAAFLRPTILVMEWVTGKVAAYDIDERGDPIAATRRDFVQGLIRPVGAAIDPVTGDLLIADTGPLPNSATPVARIVVISGLVTPPNACPCDWNRADGLDSQDFFDFLESFFNGAADFNGADGTDSQDFFDFLECFFTGCE